MLDSVTIGQYWPGDTPVHRLDPRVKILLVGVFMVSVFLVETYFSYLIFVGLIIGITLLSEIPVMRLIKGLKPIVMILIFTFIINVLFTPGKVLWQFGVIRITEQGLNRAAFIAIRLMLLVIGTSLLTLTTSPLELTDGIASLLSPLEVVHFPAHIIAMMISIALRFIPTLFHEADKIMRAQKARGADFESGNIIGRAKAMIPLLVPLFLNAINRADELGIAMEARCYHDGSTRTRLNPLKLRPMDILVFVAGTAVLIAISWFL